MRRDQAHKYLLQTLLEVENVQATSPFILFKYQDEPALEIEWSYLTSDGHEDAEESVAFILSLKKMALTG